MKWRENFTTVLNTKFYIQNINFFSAMETSGLWWKKIII